MLRVSGRTVNFLFKKYYCIKKGFSRVDQILMFTFYKAYTCTYTYKPEWNAAAGFIKCDHIIRYGTPSTEGNDDQRSPPNNETIVAIIFALAPPILICGCQAASTSRKPIRKLKRTASVTIHFFCWLMITWHFDTQKKHQSTTRHAHSIQLYKCAHKTANNAIVVRSIAFKVPFFGEMGKRDRLYGSVIDPYLCGLSLASSSSSSSLWRVNIEVQEQQAFQRCCRVMFCRIVCMCVCSSE